MSLYWNNINVNANAITTNKQMVPLDSSKRNLSAHCLLV